MIRSSYVCGVAVALMGMVVAPPADAQNVYERVDVELTTPGRPLTLDVTLFWGDLDVRAHDGEGVLVELYEPAHEVARGTRGRPEMRVSERDNNVTIEPSENPRRRFESAYLIVRVPSDSRVRARMLEGGEIRLSGLVSEIEISNQNGSIALDRVGGVVVADAVNGSIVGSLVELESGRDMWFTSLNGEIDLTVPDDFAAQVHLATQNGRVISDFEIRQTDPVTRVQRPGESAIMGSFVVTGTVGGGGALFRATTRSGDIVIRSRDGRPTTGVP